MTQWVQSQNELDSKTSSQTLIFESNVLFVFLYIFSAKKKCNFKGCQEVCMLFEKVLKSRTASLRNSELPCPNEVVFIVVIL